jgi:hypothetical protein
MCKLAQFGISRKKCKLFPDFIIPVAIENTQFCDSTHLIDLLNLNILNIKGKQSFLNSLKVLKPQRGQRLEKRLVNLQLGHGFFTIFEI